MFDYFGILISIILGLALTHLLRGLAKLIQMRHEVRPYWVHIVWTVNVVLLVLSIWWGMYWWKSLQTWTTEWFFFISMYAIVLFMWASMLYPPEFFPGLDCEKYFFENRRWFFGTQLTVLIMDSPETIMKQVWHIRMVPIQYWYLVPVLILITVIGLCTENRRVHAVLSVSWTAIFLCYMFLSSLARIVGA